MNERFFEACLAGAALADAALSARASGNFFLADCPDLDGFGVFAEPDLAAADFAEGNLADIDFDGVLRFALVFAAVAKWEESSRWTGPDAGDPAQVFSV
ncbi:MAG: hypothetical protein WBV39_05260 [Rudaea sp.]